MLANVLSSMFLAVVIGLMVAAFGGPPWAVAGFSMTVYLLEAK